MRFTLALCLVLVGGCTHKNGAAGRDMRGGGVVDMARGGGDLAGGGVVDLAGSDGPSCGAEGDKCTTSGGGLGLCNAGSGICACGGASADGDCNTAYGNGTTTYVCSNGACVPGSCSTSASCTMGQQCLGNNCTACSGSGATDTCKSDPVYGNAYQCVNGQCTPGNCRHDSDCAKGGNTQLCLNNTCTPCSSDQQCQSDTDATGTGGASSLCATSMSGVCVKNVTCIVTGSGIAAEEAACAGYNNGQDICCGGKCLSGTADPNMNVNCCAGSSDCASTPKPVCQANGSSGAGVCSSCTAVPIVGGTTTTYWIDPAAGDDIRGTGNNSQQGCAFATIRRALQVIGGAPPGSFQLVVAAGNTTLANTATRPDVLGEVYPIVVPPNVTITTESHGGAGDCTVNVPATQMQGGKTVPTTGGFVFTGGSSGLANFTVNGGNAVPTGIAVSGYTPTAGQPVALADVAVTGFTMQGILVATNASGPPANPQLAITGGNGGTHIDKNGSDTIFANGMTVAGNVTVSAMDKGKPVTLSGNGQHGITVVRSGQLTLTGSNGMTAPTEATAVVLANNRATGLTVNQAAGGASPPPLNLVRGVTITGTGTAPVGTTFTIANAHGLRVTGGSSLTLHTSLIVGNAKGSGVRVDDYHGPMGLVVSDVSTVSLGASGNPGGDAGNNTLQGNGSSLAVNAGAGVCLAVAPPAMQTLLARGNTWAGVDCTKATTMLTSGSSCVSGAVDVAVTGRFSTNAIDVSMCQ